MLTVTEEAKTHLANLLDSSEAPEGTAVRLVPNPEQGLGLTTGTPEPDDAAYELEGRTVLVINSELNAQLDNHTLDTEQTEQGPALTIR